jgi:hypothetical protein
MNGNAPTSTTNCGFLASAEKRMGIKNWTMTTTDPCYTRSKALNIAVRSAGPFLGKGHSKLHTTKNFISVHGSSVAFFFSCQSRCYDRQHLAVLARKAPYRMLVCRCFLVVPSRPDHLHPRRSINRMMVAVVVVVVVVVLPTVPCHTSTIVKMPERSDQCHNSRHHSNKERVARQPSQAQQ